MEEKILKNLYNIKNANKNDLYVCIDFNTYKFVNPKEIMVEKLTLEEIEKKCNKIDKNEMKIKDLEESVNFLKITIRKILKGEM